MGAALLLRAAVLAAVVASSLASSGACHWAGGGGGCGAPAGEGKGTAVSPVLKARSLKELWSPRLVARLNSYDVKVVVVDGESTWHAHGDTDELFVLVAGAADVESEFRETAELRQPGDLVVAPLGERHRPVVRGVNATLLLVEPGGVVNTGDAEESALTAPQGMWL